MLNIKENKTLEGATAKTLCCNCKQEFCHGQHCFILSQSCRNSSFIVLSATWGISLSHQWHFQVELIPLQHLWGQPTAVEVSLMLGKDQVSISFQTRNGFCAPICHRGLRKKQSTKFPLPGNDWNLWMRWHPFVSLAGDFWQIGKINCSWQRGDNLWLQTGIFSSPNTGKCFCFDWIPLSFLAWAALLLMLSLQKGLSSSPKGSQIH